MAEDSDPAGDALSAAEELRKEQEESGARKAGPDPKAGKDFSAKHCTRCHVVGDLNPHGGIGSTP
nr:hypothetical protein [Desulfuromonadales bacterium]